LQVVFISSTRHWQISELQVNGQLTDKPSRGVAVSQVADSPGWSNSRNLMKNFEYRYSLSVILV